MRRQQPLSQALSVGMRPRRTLVAQSASFESGGKSLVGARPAGYGHGGIRSGSQIDPWEAQTEDVGDDLTFEKDAIQLRCPSCGSSLYITDPPLPAVTSASTRPPARGMAPKHGHADRSAGDDTHGVNVSSDHHDDDLLTTDEVADLVRVPQGTIRYWRHIGTGPEGFKIGRHVLYRYQRVREWITAQEAT